ncbi:putative permease [Rubidibacter lacunae KORDI 51-2]|uniref:Putative permease n=1 Tax=Rubidibacter lacunae KORDI 51-2 TaxID=582515 RepID=U5DIA9_9CHRO|nr:AI-2E family transporter [Rubidibacter lacunae]ERN40334.1 putative permease [Rubidibacter lacunae KORDI 51-2]
MKLGQWLGLMGLTVSLFVLWQIRGLLLLMFTAAVLATVLNTLVLRLQRWLKVPRGWAVGAIVVGMIVLAGVLGVALVPPLVEQFQELLKLLPVAFQRLAGWLENLLVSDFFGSPPSLLDPNTLLNDIPALLQQSISQLLSFFSNSLAYVLQPILVLVFTLMLLADPQPYRRGALRLFPSFYRRRADDILTKCARGLSSWFAGITINCAFIGTLSGIGLLILQVDLVLVHALLAGLLNFIPNIGPTLSVVFPFSIALLDAPWKAFGVIVLYLIIQNIESYWLTPTVMAARVSLLPAVTLGAQILFASFFGLAGLILALPLAVVSKIWIEEALLGDVLDRWGGKRGGSEGAEGVQPSAHPHQGQHLASRT